MTAGHNDRRLVKIRRRGRHSTPSQVERVAVQAGKAAPAVAIAGALVAVPTRHCLIAHPMVARETALAATQALLMNAARLYDAGPGAISPHLYWWRDGEMALLPGSVERDRVELRPPPEFVAALERLPG